MKFFEWLRPGIKVKRWFFIGILGIIAISFGLSYFFTTYKSSLYVVQSTILIIAGIFFIFLAIQYGLGTVFRAIKDSGVNVSLDKGQLTRLLVEKRILIKGPKIVVIGGGTGLSTMLRGLKQYSSNITAVVTVADAGGGSGRLRKDLGILPPGDIRHCILSLANTEPILHDLLEYRFSEGELKGQSFGNLFLAAMNGISDNFEDAVKNMSDVLAVTGRVLPVTLKNINLCGELEDGEIIKGEPEVESATKIYKKKIKRVFLEPDDAEPLQDALVAISEADVIVMGPGSLYTSVIPNLLIKGIPEAIQRSDAMKIYACNIMTQPGETDNYSVADHIKAIYKHSKENLVDYCIVNNTRIPYEVLENYKEDGAGEVIIDYNELNKLGIKIIEDDLLTINGEFVRHNADKLAQIIVELVSEKVFSKDKKRLVDYFYIKEALKKIMK